MSDEERKPMLITPPPGLLPPVPASAGESDAINTGSATRRIAVPKQAAPAPEPAATAPTFFPTVPGLPVPMSPTPGPPDRWGLVLPDGVRHVVPESGIVVGRNPVAPRAWPDAIPIAVDDPDKTVSKSHAIVVLADDGVKVIDLKSTNGTGVVDGAGTRSVVGETHVDHDGTVVLGSFSITLSRG